MNNINKTNNVSEGIIDIVNDILLTANNYIDNAIPLVKKLAESFYQQPSRETWEQLTDLFEGMGWIIETLIQIDSIKNLDEVVTEHQIWNQYIQMVLRLNNIVPELESALENNDNILIGDLLLYEITPIFEGMQMKLQLLKPEAVDQGAN